MDGVPEQSLGTRVLDDSDHRYLFSITDGRFGGGGITTGGTVTIGIGGGVTIGVGAGGGMSSPFGGASGSTTFLPSFGTTSCGLNLGTSIGGRFFGASRSCALLLRSGGGAEEE